MQLPINKDGNIELDLFEIVSEVIHKFFIPIIQAVKMNTSRFFLFFPAVFYFLKL